MSTARFERGPAPLYLISLLLLFGLAGPERDDAYDVCSDDITGDTSSCVHEQMAEYGAELYLVGTRTSLAVPITSWDTLCITWAITRFPRMLT